MCLSPVLIDNPNYGNTSSLAYLSDTTARKIAVPCGHCSVCLQLKQQYIVQRVQMESLSHDLYFGTLTYNNECLPLLQVDDFKLNHVDFSDWQKMIKMIRKHEDLPPFKYFVVSEYGGKRHRPHFHFILSFPKDVKQTLADRWSFEIRLHDIFLKYWRRNVAIIAGEFYKSGKPKVNTRNPKWINLCTFKQTYKSRNYDLHYLNPYASSKGLDDVAFYVSKYCLKFDKWFDKLKSKLFYSLDDATYKEVIGLIKPSRCMSKGFGSPRDERVIEHINNGIRLALSDKQAFYPYFISPVNGNTFPLSPYYSKLFLSVEDMEVFNARKPRLTDYDNMLDTTPEFTPFEASQRSIKFDSVRSTLAGRNTLFDDDASLINAFFVDSPVISKVDNTNDFVDDWKDFI